MLKKLFKKIREATPKQLIVAGVFTMALVAAVGLGFASKQFAAAATIRDNDPVNSIDGCANNGGIGAADATELIKDIRDAKAGKCKTPQGGNYTDLPAIYNHFGLNEADYDKFAAEAKEGILYRDGRVVVAGETVMNDALTMGRTSMSKPANIRKPIQIAGKTYYQSTPNNSFADGRQSLPVMVWFDNDGTVRTVVMNACGNNVEGDEVKSKLDCKALNKVEVAGKKNTYKFNTTIQKEGLAKVTKVEYFIDGKLWTTKTTADAMTDEYTFTKASSEVSVKVTYSLPGGKTKTTEFKIECKKTIEVAQPFYTCERLIPSARDETNRKFRFTVNAVARDGATLKNVDFSVDGVTKNAGVTQKDAQGNIYQDYDFEDNVKHTIVAKVNFNVADKVESKLCQASVTPTKKPMCEVKGKENYPPDAPECKEAPKECKPGVPIGHPDCAPLPKTGPGSLVGLFAGASIAGTAAHRIFLRFRNRDEE